MRAALVLLALCSEAWAHGVTATAPARGLRWPELISPARASLKMRVDEREGVRFFDADGLPDHDTGQFPNRRNPNSVRAQRYELRVPLQPKKAARPTPLVRAPFGIALNGVLFDPGTAEFWNDDPGSGWNYEALSGKLDLGLDANNAHVQPNGAYHYHGLPTALVARPGQGARPVLLGYAADGFPVYAAGDEPSYRLKAGTRPSGPGGAHDGTFVEDWEYVAGLGALDECNGREGATAEHPRGTYYYVVTARFPFVPRCHAGTPDASFARRPGARPPPRKGPPPFAK